MMIELKPCPFCGSTEIGAYYIYSGDKYKYEGNDVDEEVMPFIECHGCESQWFSCVYDGDEVLKAWNRRA